MPSQLSLANRALLSVGARSNISSLTEGSTESNAISILFQPTFEELARAANWNCLRKEAMLTLIKAAPNTPENPDGTTLATPPQPWLYEYLYPTDCLKLRFLLPNYSSSGSSLAPFNMSNIAYGVGGQIPFAVNYDTDSKGNPLNCILTNMSQAQAVYTVNQPNPDIWDSQFQAAFVASLAAFLVPALSLNMPMMQAHITMAERAISAARATDGNEAFVTQNRDASWITARTGASGFGHNGIGCSSPYSDMTWPVYAGG